MLVELRIRNVAVIDAVTLPLTAGLNVLTGETGAGKSIIVGSLGMLLGERAASDRVRAGAEKATVEGLFDASGLPTLHEFLDQRGIDVDDGFVVLKREIGANGRSRAWINGTSVTASLLAEVGAQLVSVHGQHDSQQLIDHEHQRDLLDAFVGALPLRARVADAHGTLATLRARERELEQRRADVEKRSDYLRFVVEEIEAAALEEGELESLDHEVRKLSHAEELRALAWQAAEAIGGDDDAALTRLGAVRRALAGLTRIDEATTRWQTTFDGVVYALDELARDLQEYAENTDVDPVRLKGAELRRDLLQGLMRKYGPEVAQAREVGLLAREELDLLDGDSPELRTLTAERLRTESELAEAASELSRVRRAGAKRLATAVGALFPELGMPGGAFEVSFSPGTGIGPAGAEQVVFLATLNAGGELRPLGRIASGGELARVMLALSTVVARLQAVPTLVFDEVDAGVGGTVAWQVGALMRRVASHHQVLAISHLAQIAARAHRHVVVRKSAVDTVTTADTDMVTDESRVTEIARMLGGDADREVSRAHARELLVRGVSDSAEVVEAADVGQRRGKPR